MPNKYMQGDMLGEPAPSGSGLETWGGLGWHS